MSDLKFVPVEGELNPEDKKVMVDGMLDYHASKGHPRKVDTYSILLKDKNDKVVGCVTVSFLWNGMEILSLWVEESLRNQGWGTKLMQLVEKEGKKRNCSFAYTNTFTWQAPKFYSKLGYTLYGKLEDFPKGNSLSYFQKNIIKENNVKKIFFTSRFVEGLFRKEFKDVVQLHPEIKLVTLPSPSPRYAAMSKSEKIARYKALLPRF